MWAGGKGKMLAHYAPHLPAQMPLGGYAEPFAGGAALFAHLHRQIGVFPAILGDVNAEIMQLFAEVKDHPQRLIDNVKPFSDAWAAATAARRREMYYEKREAYWAMDFGPEATATLYGLMRTGFNGIWQTCVASRGRYGTPVGLVNKTTPVLDVHAIMTWSAYLQATRFHSGPYQTMDIANESFVFCDPPYRDSFTTYGTGFNDDAQKDLIAWCQDLAARKNCKVWLANRDAGDGFFERETRNARILHFPVTYTAGRRKKTDEGFVAKPATELLLMWN